MDDNQMPSASPLPPEDDAAKTIDFYTAIKEMALGKRVTKLEWGNKNSYCLLSDGLLKIKLHDKDLQDWIICDGDIAGLDWVVLE